MAIRKYRILIFLLTVISLGLLSFFVSLRYILINKFSTLKFFYQVSPTLAQQVYFKVFPRYPKRLEKLLQTITDTSEVLTQKEESLRNILNSFDCRFAVSECFTQLLADGRRSCSPGKTVGSPISPNISQKELLEEQENIADLTDYLSFLRELLEKEVTTGLPKELETLRQDVSVSIKENVEKVMASSEEIITEARKNEELYKRDYIQECRAQCEVGPVCRINTCIAFGSGTQKNIAIKVRVGLRFNDLNIGKIGINEISLVLPNKLNFPKLADLPLVFKPQTVEVCSSLKPIDVSAEPPLLSSAPQLSFECPSLPFDILEPSPKLLATAKLPKDINIPFPSVPQKDICQFPSQHFSVDSNALSYQLLQKIIQEFEDTLRRIQEEIDRLSGLATNMPAEQIEELEEYKKSLLENYEKMSKQLSGENISSSFSYEFSGSASENYKYMSEGGAMYTDSKKLFFTTRYICGDNPTPRGKNKIEPSDWYIATLEWLMSECNALIPPAEEKNFNYYTTPEASTSTATTTVLYTPKNAPDCYDPQKVVDTIINECKKRWERYCKSNLIENPLPPPICDVVDHSCNFKRESAIFYLCQKLLGKNCTISEIYTTCYELRKTSPNIPSECKFLPLLLGKLENPVGATYTPNGTCGDVCASQILLNLPYGFGTGFGFNCPIKLDISSPAISLPDIVIPDINLPTFGIEPFFRIKLPRLIIEDLIIPDIELCDFNKCALNNILPTLNFKPLQLNFTPFDVSTEVPDVPGLQLRTRVELERVNLYPPTLNLANHIIPQLKVPSIPLPEPEIDFAITSIDLGAIFQYILSFILNAVKVPTFSGCLTMRVPTTFLNIAFPDYYISLPKFLPLKKIPYCENLEKFCANLEKDLKKEEKLEKFAKEIEEEFNKKIDEIQKELNEITEAEEEVKKVVKEILQKSYGETIKNEIAKALGKKGLKSEDFFNPKTEEIDLRKVPFPGVFPITKKSGEECLPVSLPETKITLKFGNYSERKVEKVSTTTYTVYVPLKVPPQIDIRWPSKLKKLPNVPEEGYQIPEIKLSKLNFKRDIIINGPGFQPFTFSFNFNGNWGDCRKKEPETKNPLPMVEITHKVEKITKKNKEVSDASKKIIEILK